MKNIFRNMCYQLRLSYLAKHFIILLMCAISIIALYSFSQFQQLNQNIVSYNKSVKALEESGISEEEALLLKDERQEIKMENGNILSLEENYVKASSKEVTKTLYSISPYYFLQNILEGAIFIFFPIILCVYAIFIGSLEYDNRVIRVRASKTNWGTVMLSKIFYLSCIGILFILLTSLLSYVVASIQFTWVKDTIIQKFMTDEYKVPFNIFQNISICILVSLVFISISVWLCAIFKNATKSLLCFLLYMLAIPSLGLYDLKNILMNFTNRYFPYNGTSQLANVQELPIMLCLGYALIFILITATMTYIISKRQNKYI